MIGAEDETNLGTPLLAKRPDPQKGLKLDQFTQGPGTDGPQNFLPNTFHFHWF